MSRPPYLTKSRFKQALDCPDKLYYTGKKHEYGDNRDEDEFLAELAKGGIQVGELAKCYFPDGIEVETLEVESAIARTRDLMQQENVTIFEAAIVFKNLLVRVDVLEKKGNTLNLYEAKARSFSSEDEIFTSRGITAKWKPYVYDIAFQVYVTRKAYPDYSINGSLFIINKNRLCTVDGLYQKFLVRKIEGRYKVTSNPSVEIGEPILTKIELGNTIDDILLGTEDLMGKPVGFGDWVEALAEAYATNTRLNTPVSGKCRKCEYKLTDEQKKPGLKSGFEECWLTKTGIKPDDFARPHIFEIWNFRYSQDMIDQKRYFIYDLTKNDFAPGKTTSKRRLPPYERQWLQVERVHNPDLGPYYDKSGLEFEFRQLRYPLHFIDFETTRNAIPYLKGLRPYSQLAFQFSCHTLEDSGHLSHGEWIETRRGHYPNFDFVRNLKAEIGNDSGSILIYSSYENSVLLDIYDHLIVSGEPDKDDLISFIRSITWSDKKTRGCWTGERKMVDMKDWVMDYYYSPIMKGSNSIKAVLPAIINDSSFVREKYPEWIRLSEDGRFENPYRFLPRIFDDHDLLTLETLLERNDVADGGAAMCAFNLMQFSEMSDAERQKIIHALLEYCKLDTLAMVMLFDGLRHFGT